MKYNTFLKILAIILLIAILFVATSGCGEQAFQSDKTSDYAVVASDTDPILKDVVSINFSRRFKGKGYDFERKKLVIEDGGVYALTGVFPSGRIVVEAKDEDVTLILNGVYLSTASYAAITADCANLTIHLADQSVNLVADGQMRKNDSPNACIYSESNLKMTGSGQLTVQAFYENGIYSDEELIIEQADLTVEAPKYGIVGKDGVILHESNINIESVDDAICSIDEDAKIAVSNSELTLNSENDGIEANDGLLVSNSDIAITTFGGAKTALGKGVSAKGLKAEGSISVDGGKLVFNCADDALCSETNVMISSGDITIETARTGLHAQEMLCVSNGNIQISRSSIGMEGGYVEISGGSLMLDAVKDGIVARASDPKIAEGEPDGSEIRILGGNTAIYTDKNGIRSGGSILQKSGTLLIYAPSDNKNTVLDYVGEIHLMGGTLLASGRLGETVFPANIEQPILSMDLKQEYPAQTPLAISDGTHLWVIELPKESNHLVFSAPTLLPDAVYTIMTGTDYQGEAEYGFVPGGILTNGTVIAQSQPMTEILPIPKESSSEESSPKESESQEQE